MPRAAYTTVMDAALAAKSIYKNEDFEGFTLLGGFFDPKNDDRLGWAKAGDGGGGSAGIYKNNYTASQYVLAFRGSKGNKDWVVDDRQIVLNTRVDRVNDCIKYANQLIRQYDVLGGKASILVVGHSLGGFLAQVVGVMCNLPFITLNAPPAGRALSGHGTAWKFREGANLRVDWDPVSRAPGTHIGPLITMKHYGFNIADAHKNAAVLKSVERSGYADSAARAFITAANLRR